MSRPPKFEHCQQNPPPGDFWTSRVDTINSPQDFEVLVALAMSQEDYWQRHHRLAEEMEDAGRLKVGRPLLGICSKVLNDIQRLNDTWTIATPGQKDEVARFTLTGMAISKLVRRVLPPPPSIEERMPPHFRSVQPLRSGLIQSDAFREGYTNPMVELFPDPVARIGARLHLKKGYAASYFENETPGPDPDSEGWYESRGLLVQRQPSMPHPDTLLELASKNATMNTADTEMLTPYLQYDGRGLDSHLL